MVQAKGKEIDVAQQISFLKRIHFFHDFDDSELHQFLAVSTWLKVPQRKEIIRENTIERCFYILVKGTVSVFKSVEDGSTSIELTTLSTGDCFGEMALVVETKRTAGVRALTESFILKVEPEIINTSTVFLQLKFYRRFCEVLVTRLISANERMTKQPHPKAASLLEPKGLAAQTVPPPPLEGPRPNLQNDQPKKAEPAPSPPVKADAPKEPREERPEKVVVLTPSSDTPERETRASWRRKIQGLPPLPVNPAVAAALMPLISGDIDNTRSLAELVAMDPALSARVLQLANSEHYRRASAIITIPHAIVTIGVQGMKNVVLQTIEEGATRKEPFGNPEVARSFWLHSILVGKIAQLLKDVIRLNLGSEVYMAGLMHDLGMLAMDMLAPDLYRQHFNSKDRPDLIKMERKHAGVDHAMSGGWLGGDLGLPLTYVDVMRYHHTPEVARENVLVIALVNLAERFVALRGVEVGGLDSLDGHPLGSFSWVLIQEQHRNFLDVKIDDFVEAFDAELNKAWFEFMQEIPA